MNDEFDVVIVGSGIVGAMMALALTKLTSLSVALVDAKPIDLTFVEDVFDHRVSAISSASKKIFQNLNVWDAISKKRFHPYQEMFVWDEGGAGELHFNAHAIQQTELGFIVEDTVIRSSLIQAIQSSHRVVCFPNTTLVSVKQSSHAVELLTSDDVHLRAKLLIAADGGQSWVRQQVGIPIKTWEYGQTAIVAHVKTECEHENTARQRFLHTGPLAFLPLSNSKHCSIVWSAITERAEEICSWSDELFAEKLGEAFEHKLGKITEVSKRYHFPLQMRHAKQYVLDRIALIGDAAHTIHPLAGQGVNLGLLDAAALVEVIAESVHKNREFFSLPTLRRYERWRKSDNLVMLAMVDALKHMYTQQNTLVSQLRNQGMKWIDRSKVIKDLFANYATGNRGDLPRLAQ